MVRGGRRRLSRHYGRWARAAQSRQAAAVRQISAERLFYGRLNHMAKGRGAERSLEAA